MCREKLLLEIKVLEALYSQKCQGHKVASKFELWPEYLTKFFSIVTLSFIFLKGHKNAGFMIAAIALPYFTFWYWHQKC